MASTYELEWTGGVENEGIAYNPNYYKRMHLRELHTYIEQLEQRVSSKMQNGNIDNLLPI